MVHKRGGTLSADEVSARDDLHTAGLLAADVLRIMRLLKVEVLAGPSAVRHRSPQAMLPSA